MHKHYTNIGIFSCCLHVHTTNTIVYLSSQSLTWPRLSHMALFSIVKPFRYYSIDLAALSKNLARMMSLLDSPPTSWVLSVTWICWQFKQRIKNAFIRFVLYQYSLKFWRVSIPRWLDKCVSQWYKCMLKCTNIPYIHVIYHSLQMHTSVQIMYMCLPKCTNVYHNVQVYTQMYKRRYLQATNKIE